MNSFKLREKEHYDYPQLSIFYDKAAIDIDNGYLHRCISQTMETAIYIHIPFCDSFCLFCNYYKEHKRDDSRMNKVASAIKKEIEHYSQILLNDFRYISAVHFGGGTPTCLGVKNLADIFETIRKNFSLKKDCTVSIESHVGHLQQAEFALGLKEAGFNRISFGVQSFDEVFRKKYGLLSISSVEKAFHFLKENGISDVNIDLMYGFPDQSWENVIADIEVAKAHHVNCMDLYALNVFPGTHMEKFLKDRDMYTEFKNVASQHSYQQVYKHLIEKGDTNFVMSNTISNQTNGPNDYLRIHLGANRYEGGHVIGVGPSSRGYLCGYTYKNNTNIDGYLDAIEKHSNARMVEHYLTDFEKENRTMVMFPNFTKILKKNCIFNEHTASIMENLIRQGFVKEEDDTYTLHSESLFWAGNISSLFYSKEMKKKMVHTALMNRKDRLNMYNQDKMQITGGKV